MSANESRPAGAASDSLSDDCSLASLDLPPDLTPRRAWEAYLESYMRGYADGIEHGRRQMDEELATIQRTAAQIVHRMAKLPPRDAEADRRTAERREARWHR